MAATRSLNASSRKKKQQQPFYDLPANTPAKIIADARRSVRAIGTDRPYTPADHRILFGGSGSQSRPPSAFSIGARHFTDERSRPGTGQRLAPIEKSVIEDSTFVNKKLKRTVKETPPTPVQSFQDLSILNAYPISQLQHDCTPLYHPSSPSSSGRQTKSSGQSSSVSIPTSQSTGVLDSRPRGGSLTSVNSKGLELKQSQFSPVHSKRSQSVDALKKLLSAQLENGEDSGTSRIVSAGDERRGHSTNSDVQTRDKESGRSRPSAMNRPSHESRKSSADLPFWKAEIVPLLGELESTPYQDVEHLCECCASLWACLEMHGLLGRTGGVGGTKKRSVVLRMVFKLLDHKEPRLLLKVAKIIIAMQVTGKNLLNVCKLLFALGKDEANDKLFGAESITGFLIEALMLADPLKEQETFVYGVGTIKLLASSPVLRDQILSADVMALVENTLKVCCEACSSSQPTTGEMTHMRNILIQLTGALRSLSDAPSLRGRFVSSTILPQLVTVLSDHITSPDIVFNISRVLSKLTLESSCLTAVLGCPPLLPLFLRVLSLHSHHMDIIVRVCFILGNMTADDNDTRHQLFFQHSPLAHLNPLLKEYLALEMEQTLRSEGGGFKAQTAGSKKLTSKSEDVLIKLVRLIANLSVHPEVGPRIAGDQDTVHYLLAMIANLPLSDYEELVLNSLATLNNLSYYAKADSCIVRRQKELADLMVSVMMVESYHLLLESTRVCGNLSRYPEVRDILVKNKVDEIMVTILDSGRREMVYSACGVLINILADSSYHENVAKNGGIRKLVEVLHDFGQGDWQLASLVCKTLWNFSEKLTSSVSSVSCFGEEETIQLIQLLTNYSDKDIALSASPQDIHSKLTVEEVSALALSNSPDSLPLELTATAWQREFLPVAQALLTRIQEHHTNMIPLTGDGQGNTSLH